MKAGKKIQVWWERWFSTFIGVDNETIEPARHLSHPEFGDEKVRPHDYWYAAFICAAVTVFTVALRDWLAPANLLLAYLIAVAGVAVKLGQRPAILASFLSVLAFDFFLVPPYHSLRVEDTQYLLTFAIMLVVSLIISTMTSNLRRLARVAHYRARRASALFALSRELSAALTYEEVIDVAQRHLKGMFQAEVAFFLPDKQGAINIVHAESLSPSFLSLIVPGAAQGAYDQTSSPEMLEIKEEWPPAEVVNYVTLRAPMRNRGVLCIMPENLEQFSHQEQQRLLQTCASQIALAIERVHYVEVAQETEIAMKSEQLRNSLLNALSHDVRTPMTAIIGLSSTLSNRHVFLTEENRQELVEAIQEEAQRMSGLVTNLLDMARLQSGTIKLNRHWQLLEDVIGSSLELLRRTLSTRTVDVLLADDLPLLEFDAVLIERVFCNLLANVAKYTPANSHCQIKAQCIDDEVQIAVVDNGPGLPAGMEKAIFEKFARGESESSRSGIGLGLSICQTIVAAHGGRMWAENVQGGGARFVFTLPVGRQPNDEKLHIKGTFA
ncbi:MAG: DUF4118 domain-containing protein [Oxalobacter sp.]|nr:MAG: DUF4118 domain-containing protein [Oxalobacter sp.]